MRSAGDGDIGHAVIEQVLCSKLGIDVDEHAIGGLSLAGMTSDGIAVIEMRMLCGVDLDGPTSSIRSVTRPSLMPSTVPSSRVARCSSAEGAVSCTRSR